MSGLDLFNKYLQFPVTLDMTQQFLPPMNRHLMLSPLCNETSSIFKKHCQISKATLSFKVNRTKVSWFLKKVWECIPDL